MDKPCQNWTSKRLAARSRALMGGFVAVVALGALAGCGGSAAPQSTAVASAQGTNSSHVSSRTGVFIGESSPVASEYNVHAVTVGAEKVAEGLGWGYKMLDANLSSGTQVSDVQTLITQKVKGIIIQALNPGAASAALAAARAAGILVVGIDVAGFKSASSLFNTQVQQETDTTCVPGEQAAAYIAARIPHAKVLVVGGPPAPQILLRTGCFVQAARRDGLDVEETQYNVQNVESTAEPIVRSMLTTHSDAQAIFAFNDDSALAASSVARSEGKPIWSGRSKGMIIMGINAIPAAVAAVKAGALTGTFDPNSAEAGALAVSALAVVVKDHKPLPAMPKTISVPTKLWDSSDVSAYVAPYDRAERVSTTP